MSLQLPTVSVTLGPAWATQLNVALEAIDSHDHVSVGRKIVASALDLDGDVDLQGNDLLGVRSLRLDSLGSVVTSLRALCAVGGNLWWVNGAGTGVQLTSGGQLAVGGAGSNNAFAGVSVASSLVIQASDTWVVLKVSTVSPRTITLPLAAAVTAGRAFLIKDASGFSEANPITLNRSGSDTLDGSTSQSLSIAWGAWWVVSDGVSAWHLHRGSPQWLTKSGLVLGTGASVAIGSSVTLGDSSLSVGSSTLTASALTVGSSAAGAGTVRLPQNGSVYSVNPAATDMRLVAASAYDVLLGDNNADRVLVTPPLETASTALFQDDIEVGVAASITFATPRTRVVLQGLYDGFTVDDSKRPLGYSSNGGSSGSGAGWVPVTNSGTTMTDFYLVSSAVACEMIVQVRRPLHGATLDSVKLHYKPRAAASPQFRIRVDVLRVSPSAPSSPVSLMSGGFTQVDAYASTDWTSKTFAMDQNNVIDNDSYVYYVRVKDEAGTGTGTGSGVSALELTYTVADVLEASL